MSFFHKEKLEKWAAIITIIGFPLLIISTLAVLDQIKETREAVSTQNNIALNSYFFNNTDTGIINDIENNGPILTEHGGKYTDAQLDNYLGDFDTVDAAYNSGWLSESDLCDSFSYYIASTTENKEVQKYMNKYSEYFGGLTDLERVVASSTNPNCN